MVLEVDVLVDVEVLLDVEVLVDVEVVGICGSDMHYYKDGGIGSAKIGGLHSQVAPPPWGNVSP